MGIKQSTRQDTPNSQALDSKQTIAHVAEVVMQVVDGGNSLDRLLQASSMPGQTTESIFREMAYGTCRYFPRINWYIENLLERPLKQKHRNLHFLMAVGIYQIDHMHIPKYAALNETVEAVSELGRNWSRNLINGVLRNYLRNRDHFDLSKMPQHSAYAFPKFLFDRIKADWPDQYLPILEASNSRPPLTLRVNLKNSTRQDVLQTIEENTNSTCMTTHESPFGLSLDPPVPVNQIPGFMDGKVSVQDESAQLAIVELDPDERLKVLDGCAAPGGKTTHILELFPESCAITAIDLGHRCSLIHQNLKRLGLDATVVSGDILDPSTWWDGRCYDRILLDVPCSGSGVIRRHSDIKYRRNVEDLENLHVLQTSMLESVWNLLCPGGIVLYVTCSIFHQENDQVIKAFINHGCDRQVETINRISGISTQFGVQRLPGFQDGDGFYYCKIRKSIGTQEE